MTVMEVFSTITSPVLSELATNIAGHEIGYLPQHRALFQTLRKVNEVRDFCVAPKHGGQSTSGNPELRRVLLD